MLILYYNHNHRIPSFLERAKSVETEVTMSSADIDVVSLPNLEKIESFFNDSTYRETLEISASFNTRLCVERKSRMPFLDPQTGVAQKNCHLFMMARQRIPSSLQGQLYTYPATRWRKSKRQYLQKLHHSATANVARPFLGFRSADYEDSLLSVSLHHDDSSSLGATCDSDLKDPNFKDDLPKDWLYDDIEMQDLDGTDEAEQGDSDYDYNINGYKRKTSSSRRKPARPTDRSRKKDSSDSSSRRTKSAGSSSSRRRKKPAQAEKEHDFADQYTPAFEPPSFDTVSESFGDVNGDLRSYRKY